MNDAARQLAAELEAANDEAVAFVESCSKGQWATTAAGEDWTVGVVLHHVALGHRQMVDWLGHVRRGEAITKTAAEIDDDNARHAVEWADVSRTQTIAALRSNGAALAELLRGLQPDELSRTASFGPGNGMEVTAEQLAPVAVRHCLSHLASARAALESGRTPEQ
jgi:uncharacterized damage-inducible protein DinB